MRGPEPERAGGSGLGREWPGEGAGRAREAGGMRCARGASRSCAAWRGGESGADGLAQRSAALWGLFVCAAQGESLQLVEDKLKNPILDYVQHILFSAPNYAFPAGGSALAEEGRAGAGAHPRRCAATAVAACNRGCVGAAALRAGPAAGTPQGRRGVRGRSPSGRAGRRRHVRVIRGGQGGVPRRCARRDGAEGGRRRYPAAALGSTTTVVLRQY